MNTLTPSSSPYRASTARSAVRVPTVIPWENLLVGLLLTLLFVPSHRYTLSSALPFEAEPYRVLSAAVFLGWLGSALIDPRVRIRRTPFDAPIWLFVLLALASLVVNHARAESVLSYVLRQIGFFSGVLLLIYFIASVLAGRVQAVLLAVKVLVVAGAILGLAGIVEARTGNNIFNHLNRVLPFLAPDNAYAVSVSTDSRGADGRAFGSSQHPIEFGAVLVMLIPLALALAAATRRRIWWIVLIVLAPATISALSRTVVPMLIAGILAGLWTRRSDLIRLWPALIPLIVVIHLAVPGALGSLAKSFNPQGGIVADQNQGVGSGRVSTFGPALRNEFVPNPVLGVGFSTRVTSLQDPTLVRNAPILDDQWLGVLLETGVVGFATMLWLFLRVIRRSGAAARVDYTMRGWLLAGICSSVAMFMAGMLTFDAFAFVQVTFLFAILVGLAAALLIAPYDREVSEASVAAIDPHAVPSPAWKPTPAR